MTDMLTTFDLSCYRNERVLFSHLNFSLAGGEGLWVSGPNGSGKTSLLRIIAGLLTPYAGQVSWRGKSIQAVGTDYHRELVYLGHKIAVKSDLTVLENLRAFAALHRMSQPDEERILIKSELHHCAHILGSKLSAGQRQRLALSRLLIAPAKLWVLDEPFTALDKDGIKMMEAWLTMHMEAGGMVILASHQPLILNNIAIKQLALN